MATSRRRPGVVQSPPGYKVVRVNAVSGQVTDFAVNRAGRLGRASKIGAGGLVVRGVQFNRTGEVMCVVDFGVITAPLVPDPSKRTGVLWAHCAGGSERRPVTLYPR